MLSPPPLLSHIQYSIIFFSLWQLLIITHQEQSLWSSYIRICIYLLTFCVCLCMGAFVCVIESVQARLGWEWVWGYWSPAAVQTRAGRYSCEPSECHLSHTLLARLLHTLEVSLHKPIVTAVTRKRSLGRLSSIIKNTYLKPTAGLRQEILRYVFGKMLGIGQVTNLSKGEAPWHRPWSRWEVSHTTGCAGVKDEHEWSVTTFHCLTVAIQCRATL